MAWPDGPNQLEFLGHDLAAGLEVKNTFLKFRDTLDEDELASLGSQRKAHSDPTSSRSSSCSVSVEFSDEQARLPKTKSSSSNSRLDDGPRQLQERLGDVSKESSTSASKTAKSSSMESPHQENGGPWYTFDDVESGQAWAHQKYTEEALPTEWSVGSELHASGTCRPCGFWIRSNACRAGADCTFCHLPHEKKEPVARLNKAKRARCKRRADGLDKFAPSDAAELLEGASKLASQGSYMATRVQAKMKKLELGSNALSLGGNSSKLSL